MPYGIIKIIKWRITLYDWPYAISDRLNRRKTW
jgi:hypothetical protein